MRPYAPPGPLGGAFLSPGEIHFHPLNLPITNGIVQETVDEMTDTSR